VERPVRQLCTYFDARYLPRGLALLESLRAHAGPFRLFVLCLDEATQASMAGRPDVVALRLDELEREQPELLAAKAGRSWLEYYYTCTPALIASVLRRFPGVQLLTYLDADLYFFSSPAPIDAEIGDAGIAIVEHRFPESLRHLEAYGRFNVGWVTFRRETEALRCLETWREQCLAWCYDQVETDRFADQKYLDAWPRLYQGVAIIRHKGANLAPWNVARYALREDAGRVLVDESPLHFYHFHGLHYERPGPVRSGLAPYGARLTPTLRQHVYRPYLRALCALERQAGRSLRASRKP
jgi:hypothetical protein